MLVQHHQTGPFLRTYAERYERKRMVERNEKRALEYATLLKVIEDAFQRSDLSMQEKHILNQQKQVLSEKRQKCITKIV